MSTIAHDNQTMTSQPMKAQTVNAQSVHAQSIKRGARVVALPSRTTVADRIGFGRLVQIEARRLLDTRAGRWLLGISMASVVGIAAVVAVFYGPVSKALGQSWMDSAPLVGMLLTFLVPAMVILLFTTEWTQRTALTTFTLEPRRGRVVAAKSAVALLVAVACWLAQYAFGAIAALIGGASRGIEVSWHTDWKVMLGMLASFLLTMAMAAGFAMCFMNTAAAIVTYLALPSVLGLVTLAGSGVQKVMEWIDLSNASTPLMTGEWAGKDVWQLLVATLLWVVIPVVLGVQRQLTTEAK